MMVVMTLIVFVFVYQHSRDYGRVNHDGETGDLWQCDTENHLPAVYNALKW